MTTPSIQQVIDACQKLGYPIYEKGDYNLNIIGIRCKEHTKSGQQVTNKFKDLMCVLYKIDGEWKMNVYACTTVPGAHYFKQPINPQFGTAIVVPGHYKGAYKLGVHFGKPALQQVGKLKLYRDRNKDLIIDLDDLTIQLCGYECGINIHYSHKVARETDKVDNWSAGCQVLAYGEQEPKYIEFIDLFKKAIAAGFANSFSYTLLLESQIK